MDAGTLAIVAATLVLPLQQGGCAHDKVAGLAIERARELIQLAEASLAPIKKAKAA